MKKHGDWTLTQKYGWLLEAAELRKQIFAQECTEKNTIFWGSFADLCGNKMICIHAFKLLSR